MGCTCSKKKYEEATHDPTISVEEKSSGSRSEAKPDLPSTVHRKITPETSENVVRGGSKPNVSFRETIDMSAIPAGRISAESSSSSSFGSISSSSFGSSSSSKRIVVSHRRTNLLSQPIDVDGKKEKKKKKEKKNENTNKQPLPTSHSDQWDGWGSPRSENWEKNNSPLPLPGWLEYELAAKEGSQSRQSEESEGLSDISSVKSCGRAAITSTNSGWAKRRDTTAMQMCAASGENIPNELQIDEFEGRDLEGRIAPQGSMELGLNDESGSGGPPLSMEAYEEDFIKRLGDLREENFAIKEDLCEPEQEADHDLHEEAEEDDDDDAKKEIYEMLAEE